MNRLIYLFMLLDLWNRNTQTDL